MLLLAGLVTTASCSGTIEPEPLAVASEPSCDAGERRCEGDRLEGCNAGQSAFELLELCGAGWCDSTALECDVCAAGTVECRDERSARVCSEDGLHETLTPCEGNTPHCLAANGGCVACAPNSTECLGVEAQRACGSEGAWQEATRCLDAEACFLGVCREGCEEGTQRCVPGVDHYQVCGANNEWGSPVDCGTGSANYWDVCREGLCVDSPEHAVGHDAVTGWNTIAWDADTLILVPLRVESDSKVFAIEVITATGGGFVKVALWDDKSGYPDSLVTSTTNAAVLTGSERVTRFATPTLPSVTAGQTYWLAAVFSEDVTLYARANANRSYLSYPYGFAGNFMDVDPLPTAATRGEALDIGISLQVKDLL